MRVVDASVFTDALLSVAPGAEAARTVVQAEPTLHVPEIFPTEVLSAVRGLFLAGQVSAARAHRARAALGTVRIERYPVEPFIERIWELRENLTAYDAAYVALTESLDATLVTMDDRLIGATGPRCPVSRPADVNGRR